MNNKSEIRQEILNSDILKIFVILFSFFTLFGVVRLYFMFNGITLGQFMANEHTYVAISNNAVNNLTRPWVVITHIGAELSVMSVLSNFLWLYLFGYIIQDLKGKNSVWPLFVLAGMVSGIAVIITVYINPSYLQSVYYGMRSSVVAIAVAAVSFRPTYKVFQMLNGGFSVWILGLVFIVLSLLNGNLDVANIVAIVVAVLIGYLYNNVLHNMFTSIQYKLNNRVEYNERVEYNKPQKPKYNNNIYTQAKVIDISQHKMDELLDKISTKGIQSLTEVEKKWLEDFSRNQND